MSQTIYGPLALPTGKQIKFRRPVGLDRMNILQNMQISQDEAVTGSIMMQLFIAAKCVTEVDGQPVDGNYKALLNDWDDADINYYQAVHNEMFGLTEEKMNDAKEKAAFLLKNSTSTDGSNSQSPVTAASTDGSATQTI